MTARHALIVFTVISGLAIYFGISLHIIIAGLT